MPALDPPPRRPSLPARILLGVAAAAMAACGGDAGQAAATGVARWSLRPEVRIGSLEGEDALSRVADLALAPDGRPHVVLPQEHRVAVYGPDGRAAGSVGRQGEGPGELMSPSAVGFLGDTLWVHDGRQRRVSLYGPDGSHLDDVPYPAVAGLPEDIRTSFGSLAAGGAVVMATSAQFNSPLGGTDHPFPLLVVPREGGPPDTVATRYTAHDRAMLITGSADRITSVEVFASVFADGTMWTVDPDDASVVLVDRRVAERPTEGTYRVTRVDLAGDTAFSVEVPYRPVPIDPVRVDSVLARYTRGERTEAEVRQVLFIPDFHPPVSRLVGGGDGRIWVGREDLQDRPLSWDVFDRSGTLVARLETPPNFRLLAATTDALWGVELDELDVPYVVRYGIVEEGPDG